MLIGIPKEIKEYEYRIGTTPAMVKVFVNSGHKVVVETGAAEKIGFYDKDYLASGAQIVSSPEEVYEAEMIVKVKEPQESEYPLLKEGQILFCYLHLAPDPIQTENLLKQKVIGIAYETVTDAKGHLPLLIPMSEIAGRISIQAGATALQMNNGGRGLLLGGVPGVFPATVVVIGGGVVGVEAARMAMGLGANVIVMDRNLDRLRELDALYSFKTLYSSTSEIEHILPQADLVIGAVLIPGQKTPHIITKEMLRTMQKRSVIIDVAIDQGGCVETSRPTTHGDPTFVEEGIIHYCVTNMPGACARTATIALTNATMHYMIQIADKGYRKALLDDEHLRQGLNVYLGHVTNECVAHDLGYPYVPPEEVI